MRRLAIFCLEVAQWLTNSECLRIRYRVDILRGRRYGEAGAIPFQHWLVVADLPDRGIHTVDVYAGGGNAVEVL